MRRAYKPEIIYTDNGEFLGINLGADFTSEHEWGIDKLKSAFKIDGQKLGVEGRRVGVLPPTLYFENFKLKDKRCYLLICVSPYWAYDSDRLDFKKYLSSFELNLWSDDDICTAWDDATFGILVTEKYKDEIEKLSVAFKNLDVVIGVSPSGVFKNRGLKFLIESKMPDEMKTSVLLADLDHKCLIEAADNTGIYEILRKANKKYYACSPRWEDDNKQSVVFWLNPMEQDKNNYGWFTVKDLKEWAKGKGKIPMKRA